MAKKPEKKKVEKKEPVIAIEQLAHDYKKLLSRANEIDTRLDRIVDAISKSKCVRGM